MILGRKITEWVFEPLHHLHASVITQGFELFKNHGATCYAFLRNDQLTVFAPFCSRDNGPQASGYFAIEVSILYLLPPLSLGRGSSAYDVCFMNLPIRNHDA